jgi:hypothetical protein
MSDATYPATLELDYQDRLSRVTTIFRLILVIPIAIILAILTSGSETVTTWNEGAGETVTTTTSSGLGIVGALFVVTVLLLLFRKRYPKWWFDFNLALTRFTARVGVYILLLTDRYPSTEDDQNLHLDVPYPDAKNDLNRGLPLVKWFLAIPHYFILFFLFIAVFFVTFIGWFAIIFVGRYPILLATDKYPPFRLN